MPVIKSAIKKLRKDSKRKKHNDALRAKLDSAIREARKSPSKISAAYSTIDRAVKKNLIHKNRAARIKSSLSKLSRPTAKASHKTQGVKTSRSSKPKTPPKTFKPKSAHPRKSAS